MTRSATRPVTRSRRAVVLGASCVAWPLVAAMATIAADRALAVENRPGTALFAGLVPLALLPAYPLLVVAAVLRLRAAAVACAVLAAGHLVWVWPSLPPGHAVPEAARTAPRLRVMAANVWIGNDTPDAFARSVRAVRPDVLALAEMTPAFEAGVRAAGGFDGLTRLGTAAGEQLWARLPATRRGLVRLGVRDYPSATFAVGGASVRVVALHCPAPGRGADSPWHQCLRALRDLGARHDGALVVAGDFNAGRDHARFRDVLRTGMRDAHDERGRGLVTTWPAGRAFPRLLRLDHVVVSREVTVLGIREGAAAGSDHVPLIADLALPD